MTQMSSTQSVAFKNILIAAPPLPYPEENPGTTLAARCNGSIMAIMGKLHIQLENL